MQDSVYDAFADKLKVAWQAQDRQRSGRRHHHRPADRRKSRGQSRKNTSPTPLAKGANVLAGGKTHALGNFFEPTMLTDVPTQR